MQAPLQAKNICPSRRPASLRFSGYLVFKERSCCLEPASSLVCVEEFGFSESACRRRRKRDYFIEFTSLQSCVEESSFSEFTCRRKATSLNKLPCGFVPRNLASLNLLADAGTGAFEGISHSFKTERNESAVYRQLAIAASAFRP